MWFESHSAYLVELGFTWRQQLGRPECPYMERWVLNLGRLGSIRLHHWIRSDDKRAKHDHPADFITLVLKGSYEDWGWHDESHNSSHKEDGVWICNQCGQYIAGDVGNRSLIELMTPGRIRKRSAEHRHTVAVAPGGCWSLVYFFPDRRNWGFWTRRKDTRKFRFRKANKYFLENGHHPCDQP